jgi:hypothetical protein
MFVDSRRARIDGQIFRRKTFGLTNKGNFSWYTSLEDFQMDRSSGSGPPTRLPSRRSIACDSDSLGFRSLHGCGAAGDFHPSSSHPSVNDLIDQDPHLLSTYKKVMILCQEKKYGRQESEKNIFIVCGSLFEARNTLYDNRITNHDLLRFFRNAEMNLNNRLPTP